MERMLYESYEIQSESNHATPCYDSSSSYKSKTFTFWRSVTHFLIYHNHNMIHVTYYNSNCYCRNITSRILTCYACVCKSTNPRNHRIDESVNTQNEPKYINTFNPKTRITSTSTTLQVQWSTSTINNTIRDTSQVEGNQRKNMIRTPGKPTEPSAQT